MEGSYSLFLSSALIFIVMNVVAAGRPEPNLCSKSSTLHRKTFRSPPFSMAPGEVQNRYYDMEFPKGHLGIKNFKGEVVDELGISVPLNELYLHHWTAYQLYVRKSEANKQSEEENTSFLFGGNDGICPNHVLPQLWGLGSETRHTNYSIPDPYAINVGNPSKVPHGYQEHWELNLHAIDVRETEDPLGCSECRCDLYNVAVDEYGASLPADYRGGFNCCYEGTRCKVKPDYVGKSRKLYFQYTVEWVEWNDCVQPVRVYMIDVTDTGVNGKGGCKIEYDVPGCVGGECVHEMKTSLVLPRGGNLVYGVAHQHIGGQGMVLHGEDGRHVCSSVPLYGSGAGAGDEDGYVVGMSTCLPETGTTVLENGERLRFTSYYSSAQPHTGVMGVFYILIADHDGVAALETNKNLPQ